MDPGSAPMMTCERHELDGRLDGWLLRSERTDRTLCSPRSVQSAATTLWPRRPLGCSLHCVGGYFGKRVVQGKGVVQKEVLEVR